MHFVISWTGLQKTLNESDSSEKERKTPGHTVLPERFPLISQAISMHFSRSRLS